MKSFNNTTIILSVILTIVCMGFYLQQKSYASLELALENAQMHTDTVYVEVHDTVFLETREYEPETGNSFVDLTGLVGKQIEEISDTTDVGLEFHVKLVERLTARGYLPAEGELTYEQIHSAYHRAMNDYKISDHAISEDMLIVFGMYTY